MKIVNALQAPAAENPHKVNAAPLLSTEHAMVVHITLLAGEHLRRHITPVDIFFYVLEGSPIIEIGDEKRQVDADSLVESPAGIPHCLYNETQKQARILVVKTPRPVGQTKLL